MNWANRKWDWAITGFDLLFRTFVLAELHRDPFLPLFQLLPFLLKNTLLFSISFLKEPCPKETTEAI